jgi:hypothetical protein
VEDRGVDGQAVRAHGQRARRVAEQAQDLEPVSAQARVEVRRVEDPDVRAADARREQLRIARPVLAPVRGGDERAAAALAAEDDVARLVAHEQRPHDAQARDVDDRDAVGEVVHDPDLAARALGDRDRIDADLDGARVQQALGRDVEDLEPAVGDVADEEPRAVLRERERADRSALEQRVVALRVCRARERDDHESRGEPRAQRCRALHLPFPPEPR